MSRCIEVSFGFNLFGIECKKIADREGSGVGLGTAW